MKILPAKTRGVIMKIYLLPEDNIAIVSEERVLITNLHTGEFREVELDRGLNVIHSMMLSPAGHLVLGDSRGGVQEYNYKTGEQVSSYKLKDFGGIRTGAALQVLYNEVNARAARPEETMRLKV